MKSKGALILFQRVMVVAMIWVAVACAPVSAAWRDAQKPLLPPDAQVVTKEQRKVVDSDFDFIFFTTSLSPGSVKDFYRQRLGKGGWKEKNPMQDASSVPNFQIPSEMAVLLGGNLMFEKGEQKVIINIMPVEYSPDKKTRCIFASGKLDLEKPITPDADFVPSLTRKPKKEVAPEYPGASLIELSENQDSMHATYFVPSDIETALSFYRSRMGEFGWVLSEEAPLSTADVPEYELSKACPTCPKGIPVDLSGYKSKYAVLGFTKDKSETCKVVLSSVINEKQALDAAISSTSVSLHYEGGKK